MMKEEAGQFSLSEVIIFTLFLYLLYFFLSFLSYNANKC
jgi:hypothetical protein